MRYQIHHHTHYTYRQPVTLQAHTLRLRPRSDGSQQVEKFELDVDPRPLGQTQLVETDGNLTLQLWFAPQPTAHLRIQTESEVVTYRHNPFDYLAEPWAITLPIDCFTAGD
jgi:transglutaminase-like putative cysteine protease